MIAKVCSAAVQGVEAQLVEVEVGQRVVSETSPPSNIIVGLPDAAVRESSERVKTALKAAGFFDGNSHIINLAPADLKKEGPSFDLPIAIGMALCELKQEIASLEDYLIVGELSLDGSLRPVKGILSLAVAAKAHGKRAILLPIENAEEASLISDLEVYGASDLTQAWNHLTGQEMISPLEHTINFSTTPDYPVDFSEVKGQAVAKRSIEIAAAGGHNLLLSGPPGTGKSMLAQRIPTILPPLTEAEAIETTKVYSVRGLTNGGASFIRERPYRSPHHTISEPGLIGGGSAIAPGEISMAHNGVLFLDEFPEFKRSTLEILRQPLEDGEVTISRASGTLTFPSKFILAAAMNPCPCGYYGDAKVQCKCNPFQLENYQNRLSGPIMDRIDIHITVPRVDYQELRMETEEESSSDVRQRVINARSLQAARYQGYDGVYCNAHASGKLLKEHCQLDEATHSVLERSMERFGYSGRAHNRILKLARTIADLDGQVQISQAHVMEALNLRSNDRKKEG